MKIPNNMTEEQVIEETPEIKKGSEVSADIKDSLEDDDPWMKRKLNEKEEDIEDLPEGGVITGITGGQYGLIFQENRITRMDYRGGNVIFSFRRVEDNRGAVQGKNVIQVGNLDA